MLVLSRKRDEEILICDPQRPEIPLVRITVVDIRGDKVRLGVEAQKEIPVHRHEIYDAIQRQHGGNL